MQKNYYNSNEILMNLTNVLMMQITLYRITDADIPMQAVVK